MTEPRALSALTRGIASAVTRLRGLGCAHEARRQLAAFRLAEGGFPARVLAPLAEEDAEWCDDGIGVAWFPIRRRGALGEMTGGLVRVEVHASPRRSARQSQVSVGVVDALLAGARLAGRPDAVGLGCTFWPGIGGPIGLELDIEGHSFQMAIALAAWSFLVGRRLPAQVAWTGELAGDADALRTPAVDAMASKREAVESAWPDTGRLVVGGERPSGEVATLAGALAAYLDVQQSLPDIPVRERAFALQAFAARGDVQTLEHAETVLRQGTGHLDPGDLYAAATIAVQQANHRGESERALSLGDEARPWEIRARPADRATMAASLVISYIDLGRPEQACEVATAALGDLPNGTWRGTSGDLDRVQLLGSLARALSASARHSDAIAAAREAVTCAPSAERARSLGDLALWQLRAGELDAARSTLQRARDALPEAIAIAGEQARHTQRYLDLYEARIALAQGDHEHAEAISKTLDPGRDVALGLGALELLGHVGGSTERLAAELDARLGPRLQVTGVLSRYRARAELARRSPDLDLVDAWSGGFDGEKLRIAVPY